MNSAEKSNLNDAEQPASYPTPSRAAVLSTRAVAALLLVAALFVLGVAAWLKPDARGYGTHAQLVGPCGMLVRTGYPCPTCGMTTAFAYTVRGRWLAALDAQVAGFVFALATIAAAPFALWTLIRGRWPQFAGLWLAFYVTPYRLFLSLLILLLGSWALKIVLGLARHTLPVR